MALEKAKTAMQSVCNGIQSLMTAVRPPASIVPGIIMICSLAKRPGLSTIMSVGNILSDLSKKGFVTSKGADGSANKTALFVQSVVSEIYRALKNDMNLQIAMNPETLIFTGSGANSGGPVVVTGTNITTGKGVGVCQ